MHIKTREVFGDEIKAGDRVVWLREGSVTIDNVTIVGIGSFATESRGVITYHTLSMFEIVS